MAEWLRRWTANPLCSARMGSNPILVVSTFMSLCYLVVLQGSWKTAPLGNICHPLLLTYITIWRMSSTCLTVQSPLSPFSLDLWDVTFNLLSQLITQLQTASHFQHCINQQNRDLNPGASHLKSDSPPSELLRSKVTCLQSRLKQHSWKHSPFPKSLKSGV